MWPGTTSGSRRMPWRTGSRRRGTAAPPHRDYRSDGTATVEAAMRQAGPAAPGQLSTEGFPGSVQSHTRVARRHTGFRGEVADAEAVEVDSPDCRAVLGLE